MENKALIKKYLNYKKAHNDKYPKCFVCEKEIVAEIDSDFEYVKQYTGREIFMHKKCFEKRFLCK